MKKVLDKIRRFVRSIIGYDYYHYKPWRVRDRPTSELVTYLRRYINDGDQVLEVGSGDNPFPLATHLFDFDLSTGATDHRPGGIVKDRPFTHGDICKRTPYHFKQFDFVICRHVLEHTSDPIAACRELQRIGKAGYISCPSTIQETLWPKRKGHKTHIWKVNEWLIFMEKTYETGVVGHPYENLNLFDFGFVWQGSFSALAVWKNGTLEVLDRRTAAIQEVI